MSHSFTQKLTGRAVRYVAPVPRGNAVGLVADVYAQAEREFDLVPPVTIHSPVDEILAGFWGLTREAYIVGRVGRANREIVAAAVSQINDCPFCVEIHTAMLHATSQHELASTLLDPAAAKSSANPLAQWALATRTPGAPILASPPFLPADSTQVIGTAILYHYLNRMVNVFLEPSPSPVQHGSHAARNRVGRVLGFLFRWRFVRIDARPGMSLAMLPEAPLPTEFAWARTNASVAGALARFSAAIEAHGERVIPAAVRDVVAAVLHDWRGDDPGLSMHWLDEATNVLTDPFDRASARLALLTAIASYRVDETVISTFRSHRPSDADLIANTAWASLKATQRISTWIAPPFQQRLASTQAA